MTLLWVPHRCVISTFNQVAASAIWCTVMGQQVEKQGTDNTSLWGCWAQCGGALCVITDPQWLRMVSEMLWDPVAQWSVEAQQGQLPYQLLRDAGIDCRIEIYKHYSHWRAFPFRVGEGWMEDPAEKQSPGWRKGGWISCVAWLVSQSIS